MSDVGVRVAATMKAIFEELPDRLGVNAIVIDAHARLSEAAGTETQHVNEKLVEVLREIATYAVEQFTRRTGLPFMWEEEPEPPEPPEPLMHFSLDEKGNVVF